MTVPPPSMAPTVIASMARTIATSAAVPQAVLVIPSRLTAVKSATTATATGRSAPGAVCAAKARAMVAARRDLPRQEGPAGDEAPAAAEPLAAVDVGAARGRVASREAGGGGGVACGDRRGQRQRQQQPRAGGGGSRAHCDEDARAHHRSETDHGRAAEAEPASEAVGRAYSHRSSRTVVASARGGTHPPSRLVVMGAGSCCESSGFTT